MGLDLHGQSLADFGDDRDIREVCKTLGKEARSPEERGSEISISESEICAAIAEQRIGVLYQPKFCLTTDMEWIMDGVEALARLFHPARGEVPPRAFIDVVEQAGLVAGFTSAVMSVVLRDLALLRSEGHILEASVNVSPTLLADPDLSERLETAVRDHHLSPSQLVLEITEGVPWPDDASVMRNISVLRVRGVRFSLDDFGKGYSSLAQLHRLPLSELKIDRSLIAAVESSEDARIITRSMIDLAHTLGLKVCAEGIETLAQLEFLRAAGCDRAQGYLLERSVNLIRLRELLRRPQLSWPRWLATAV